jgi:6-phosphogluconolactonase
MRSARCRLAATGLCCSFVLAACGGGGGGGGGSSNTPPVNTPTSFTVGGTVTGLEASGLVLQINAGEQVTVSSSGGAFTFPTAISNGGAYSVSIKTQPNIGPVQICTVTNGDGSVAGASVTSVTVNCVTKTAKFLYVTNQGANDVSAYTIDASTGTLAPVANSPFATEPAPRFVTAEPTGKYLYVTTLGSSTNPPRISGFSLNGTTGVLTELANSPFELSATPPAPNAGFITLPGVHPSGTLGYLSVWTSPLPGTATLYGAAIDAASGDLAEIAGMPISDGSNAQTPFFDASGSHMYLATNASQGAGGEILSFQVSSPSGVLTPIGTPTQTGGISPVAALTPDGKFVIAANGQSGTLSVFSVDSAGTLSAVGSPVASGGPGGSGVNAFTYNRRLNVIYFPITLTPQPALAAFAFNTTTGALTPLAGSPYSSNGATSFPWQHASGKFIYQVNNSNGTLQRWSIDQTTGVPTLVGDVTAPSDAPFLLIPDPSGHYVYVTSNAAGKVSSYSVNQTTGALTPVSTLASGAGAYVPQPVGLQ